MSIRLRLSLLYSAILALTLVIVSIVLYTTQSQYTLDWLKHDMIVSSKSLVESLVQRQLGDKQSQPEGRASGPPPSISLSDDQAFQRKSQQEIVRVLDPDGNVIGSPVGAAEITLPLETSGLNALHKKQDWWATETVSGIELLIYSRPVVDRGRVIAILQVARALTERDQSLQSLGRTLVIATLMAVLAAFGMGWLMAREALAPIRRISQTAQAIGSERDFTRRVAYSGPKDEVGQLALTFNSMLVQMEDAYQKVAHALDMQRNFVADVSHELRTPLTTLRGNLELLNRGAALPEADREDILHDMVDESDRLIRLVNDLLALARADSGRNLAQEAVDLGPLMEETGRQARHLAPERQIDLEIGQDLTTTGDRDAIKQILLILLDNALKHTQGAIFLSAQATDRRVTLCVQDEGPGIPPDQLAHVFDRFYRSEDRMTTPGLGLGLPIAKALVEGLGGTISIESDIEKGTVMLISLRGRTPEQV